MKKLLALLLVLPALAFAQVHTNPSSAVQANVIGGTINGATIGATTPAAGTFTTGTTTTAFRAPNGTATIPGYGFTNFTNSGLFIGATNNRVVVSQGGTAGIGIASAGVVLPTGSGLYWGTSADPDAALQVSMFGDVANTISQRNGTAAQNSRLYFSTTGPIYVATTARTNGYVVTGTGGAMQISTAQTTAPTCSSNCGTSPSIAGTDTAGIVTMGATGVPASAWVVTFNGTWPAAPSCNVQSALASMVVGKMPIAVVTSTTTITVTTNGTAPANADKYQYICVGVS